MVFKKTPLLSTSRRGTGYTFGQTRKQMQGCVVVAVSYDFLLSWHVVQAYAYIRTDPCWPQDSRISKHIGAPLADNLHGSAIKLPCHCCASLPTSARCSAQVRACGNLRRSHAHLLCPIGLPGVLLGSNIFVPLAIILCLQASMGVYCHNK